MGGEATSPQCITQGKISERIKMYINPHLNISEEITRTMYVIMHILIHTLSILTQVSLNITLAPVRFLGLILYYINRPLRTQKTLIIIKYDYLYP